MRPSGTHVISFAILEKSDVCTRARAVRRMRAGAPRVPVCAATRERYKSSASVELAARHYPITNAEATKRPQCIPSGGASSVRSRNAPGQSPTRALYVAARLLSQTRNHNDINNHMSVAGTAHAPFAASVYRNSVCGLFTRNSAVSALPFAENMSFSDGAPPPPAFDWRALAAADVQRVLADDAAADAALEAAAGDVDGPTVRPPRRALARSKSAMCVRPVQPCELPAARGTDSHGTNRQRARASHHPLAPPDRSTRCPARRCSRCCECCARRGCTRRARETARERSWLSRAPAAPPAVTTRS